MTAHGHGLEQTIQDKDRMSNRIIPRPHHACPTGHGSTYYDLLLWVIRYGPISCFRPGMTGHYAWKSVFEEGL